MPVLLGYFPEAALEQEMPYKALARAGRKIILPPCQAETIAIYDCEKRMFCEVPLEPLCEGQKNLCKFWTSIAYQEQVYLIGHYYPAIVKMNIHTLETYYLTDWVVPIEKRRRLENSPYLGIGIVRESTAFFPCCCTNLILKMDLETDEITFCEIETQVKGFNGICYLEGKYWLTSRDTPAIVIWDESENRAETVEVEKRKTCEGKVSFAPSLIYGKKLYLLPYRAAHAYCIDTSSADKKIQRLEKLDPLFLLRQGEVFEGNMVTTPSLVDGKILFVTQKDMLWHIYAPDTDTVMDFSAQMDVSEYKRLKKRKLIRYVRNAMDKGDKIPVIDEAESFSCEDLCSFISEYGNEIRTLYKTFKPCEKNAGQDIYHYITGRLK